MRKRSILAAFARPPSRLEQRQLGSRMRALTANDGPHPSRPARQVQQAGELSDVGAIADLTVRGERSRPRRVGQLSDSAGHSVVLGREAN